MYANCGSLAKAREVFDILPDRDVVTWTALIAGYVQHERGEEALNCFEQMQLDGISPNAVTFACSLKACGSIGATYKGSEIHANIAKKGLLERDLILSNALVDMYAKCGSVAQAQDVFDKFVITWTGLVAGYAQHERGEEALNCFNQMQLEGVSPNAIMFSCSLKARGSMGATDKGREIHAHIARKGLLRKDPVLGTALVDMYAHIARKGLLRKDPVLGTALVDMYAKCGLLAKTQDVFDNLPIQDVVSWNSLITGHAQIGEVENVFRIFDRMRGEGNKPNAVTFVSILNACSHAGLIDRGQIYYEAMSKDYGITPSLEHHTCMFDLLGRAGQFDGAVAAMKKTSSHPNIVLWLTVLGAVSQPG